MDGDILEVLNDENVLKSKDSKRPKFDEEGNLLNTSKNKMKDRQQQQQPLIVKDQSNSTEKYTDKGNLIIIDSNLVLVQILKYQHAAIACIV